MNQTSRIIRQIDTYDIWLDPDGSYTVNAEEGNHTRLIGNVQSLDAALHIIRRDMMGN